LRDPLVSLKYSSRRDSSRNWDTAQGTYTGHSFYLRDRRALRVYYVLVVVRIDVSQIKAFYVNLTPPSTS
jgi:hypothetical protein